MTEATIAPPELKTPETKPAPTKQKPAATLGKPAEPEPPYTCETSCVGSMVKWLPPGKPGEFLPGIVRRINADGTLALTVFSSSPHPDVIREAVYHAGDPRAEGDRGRTSRYGLWDFTDDTKLLRELKAKLLSK